MCFVGSGEMDFTIFLDWGLTIMWALVGGVSMGLSFVFFMWIFDQYKDIDEFQELKNNNIAIGIFMAGLVIALSIIVSTAMKFL